MSHCESDVPRNVRSAAELGPLRVLDLGQQVALMKTGQFGKFPVGTLVYAAEDKPPFVALMVEGFLRVFVTSPVSGRETTIRYVRPGDLLGVVAALSGPSACSVQTLADTLVWKMPPEHFRNCAALDPAIAMLLADECARRAEGLVKEIAGTAFATVRQRIAHHLLSMATGRTTFPFLLADITQADLANAIGSVREVTVRELRALRGEGLLRLGRGGVTILNPDQLERIAAEIFIRRTGT